MTAQTLSLEDALTLLRSFSCTTQKFITSETDKQQLRQAVYQVVQESDWQNLGICANTATEAMKSLNSYLKALEYPIITENPPEQSFPDAVYLKYNSQKQSYYLDGYSGEYRGVLMSFQGENEQIVGTYGHFPLDLFEDS